MACFVLLLYRCTLSNLTTGTDLRMNVFSVSPVLILQEEKPWAPWKGPVEHLLVCSFNKIVHLRWGGQKKGLFLSGERRQAVRDSLLGELWDYSTVSCWTLSWAGRLMWAKTSNASQHLTKVKHFLCLSLPVSSGRREICSGKSEMKCQERSDCLGKGDPN